MFVKLYITSTQTDVALRNKKLLLFSTLNGTLIAIDKLTGDIVWSIRHSKMPDFTSITF